MSDQHYKFKGGVWIGLIAATWPFGTLEVSPDQLVIAIEGLPFSKFKSERRFTKEEIKIIKILKFFPIIGYGVHIIPHKIGRDEPLYFWYTSFRFKKLFDTLKQFGWLK